jgi:hypothetical protein
MTYFDRFIELEGKARFLIIHSIKVNVKSIVITIGYDSKSPEKIGRSDIYSRTIYFVQLREHRHIMQKKDAMKSSIVSS